MVGENLAIFLRRDEVVKKKVLYVSKVIGPDKMLLGLLTLLQQAGELAHLKPRLKSEDVPKSPVRRSSRLRQARQPQQPQEQQPQPQEGALLPMGAAEEHVVASLDSSCAVTVVESSSEASGSSGSKGSAGSTGGSAAVAADPNTWVVRRHGAGPDLVVDLYGFGEVGMTGVVLACGRHGKLLEVRWCYCICR